MGMNNVHIDQAGLSARPMHETLAVSFKDNVKYDRQKLFEQFTDSD